MERARS